MAIRIRGTDSSFASMQFFGTGSGDIDRVKIPVNSGEPANVGATNFTIDLWLAPDLFNDAVNPPINAGPAITPGANNNWILGNTFYDRDRFDAIRTHGLSLTDGRVTFGVGADPLNNRRTIRGTTDIRDTLWHHIAATRNVTTGDMAIYVDGTREAFFAGGPTGDISYPPGNPTPNPGGENSDPFLVLGAEKHDAGVGSFPSIAGFMTQLRLSNNIRYTGNTLIIPTAPFVFDANTVALYAFEGDSPILVTDGNNNLSPGAIMFGGPNNGPVRSTSSPFN